MQREPGYYWVKEKDVWQVAEWDADTQDWYLPGFEWHYTTEHLQEINENRLLSPDEINGMSEMQRLLNGV